MATKTTIEVPVEEQTIQQEITSQECVEATTEPQTENCESIANLDKEGVLAHLAERVSEDF